MTPPRVLTSRARRWRAPLTTAVAVVAAAAVWGLTVPGPLSASARTPDTAAPAGSAPSPTAAPENSPVADHGQLQVCGTQLCDASGDPVQLRGMSTHGTQWYAQCVTEGSLDALADDWGADVLRVSTYVQEDGYATDPQGFTDLASRIIDQATARGMYVVVDWHLLDPGDPNVNTALAKDFFTEITRRHGEQTNLLYEIANEPNGVSWADIKGYAEEVIPVIREQDPLAPVLVGTRAWSSFGVSEGADEQEVVDNPVDADNVMYTFHFYAASHGEDYLRTLARAADQLPVFVTEFGTQEYTGDGTNDFDSAQRYLDLMAEKKISWTNWNLSDDFRSGAVFTEGTCSGDEWTGTGVLKEAGKWIRERVG